MKKSVLKVSLFALAIVMAGCELSDPIGNRTSQEDLENAAPVVENSINSQISAVKVFENVNNYGISEEGVPGRKSGLVPETGPAVTWEGFVMTLDYANVPNAEGVIVVEFNKNPAYSTGLVADITYNGYKSEGVGVSGSMVLTITNYVAGQLAEFTLKTDGDLTFTEGSSSFLWACDQTISWNKGIANFAQNDDDEFVFDGTITQKQDGKVNKQTLDNLIFADDCDYVKDGILDLVIDQGTDNEFEISADFGVGATPDATRGLCDRYVKLYTSDLSVILELE